MERPELREQVPDAARAERFRLRSEYVISEYLRDHPASRLRERVGDRALTLEDAFEIMREANVDEKTELDNAKFLKYILNYEMAQARETERPVSLVIFDIDDFKKINTELGHAQADQVLREVAKLMQSSVRTSDEVSPYQQDQAVSRWGGEEFVVVLPEADAEQAREVAERIRARIEAALASTRPDGKPVTVTGGVATYEAGAHETPASWLAAADKSMMDGKQIEKNKVYPEAAAA